jgi:hypothetical protein
MVSGLVAGEEAVATAWDTVSWLGREMGLSFSMISCRYGMIYAEWLSGCGRIRVWMASLRATGLGRKRRVCVSGHLLRVGPLIILRRFTWRGHWRAL